MKIKRIVLLVVIITMCFGLVGCADEQDNTTPKNTVIGFMNTMKEYDIEGMKFYLNKFPDTSDYGVTYDLFSDKDYITLYKTVYKKLSFKITDVTETEKTATVQISVTHPDLKTAYSTAMTMATAQIFSDDQLFNSVMSDMDTDISYIVPQKMKEIFESDQVESITTEYTLTLQQKEDKTWAIQTNDSLRNLMSSKVFEITSSIAGQN